MEVVLLILAVLPAVAALGCVFLPHRLAGFATVAVGTTTLVLALVLVGRVGEAASVVTVGFLRVDALSLVFVLPTAFLYAVVGLFSIGYLEDEARFAADVHGDEERAFRRYSRLFHVGFNAFAWSMLCAPMVDGLALLWIAVEITTVVSALLVALDDTDGATEAAWKYVLIASCGLGIGLLATIVMYYAGAEALGQSYDLSFDPLIRHAAELPDTPVKLAFVLAVVGFGTKVGLVPMHTWLPDAHAEAPTPVSALLSGSLLAVSFYAILRYFQVAQISVGPAFGQHVLLVFGVASLLLASLSLLQQTDLKRLLAYSSIEHMGIIAIGVSFGAPLAVAGIFLHVLAHAAAKGNAFMCAGMIVRVHRSKALARIRGANQRLPWTGPIFLASVLALCALPPFGIFRSEFSIVAGGVQSGRNLAAAILVVVVTIAFLGLLGAAARLTLGGTLGADLDAGGSERLVDTRLHMVVGVTAPGAEARGAPASGALLRDDETNPRVEDESLRRGEPSAWTVAAPLVGLVTLVVLGIHPPAPLVDLLDTAASQIPTGASR
ncbi:MAG TPA: proton-conducting transporter membrane subunit [Marmoricola sp.]|nr:proton-conducting transporter membrane subunit [Marmoricola sp.]